MNEELRMLGLLPSGLSEEETMEISRKYYPHSTSHFLGLDVHDTGERDDVFEAGMVITCEPGIYIREEGIGIRLEDDIRITES
jgi:Xaa-Pro aminopeptidase